MSDQSERRVLLAASEITTTVEKLADQIATDGGEEMFESYLLLVCVLESARFFAQDLQNALYERGLSTHLEYVSASSYGADTVSNGKPRYELSQSLAATITDKNVLVVEDMIDTGITLAGLVQLLQVLEPKSLNVTVLLQKLKEACDIGAQVYVGEAIPDLWVDGFGIDSAGKNRELEDIWAVLRSEADVRHWEEYRNRQHNRLLTHDQVVTA